MARAADARVAGRVVRDKKTEDDRASGRCTLEFNCTQAKYAQLLQGQSAVVKLDVLSRRYLPNFSEKERLLPIELPPLAINDEIILAIPAGYAVDELPAKTSLETPYGSCQVSYEIAGEKLLQKRAIIFNKSRVPVEEYAALRQFLSDIAKADRSSVLLKRQG